MGNLKKFMAENYVAFAAAACIIMLFSMCESIWMQYAILLFILVLMPGKTKSSEEKESPLLGSKGLIVFTAVISLWGLCHGFSVVNEYFVVDVTDGEEKIMKVATEVASFNFFYLLICLSILNWANNRRLKKYLYKFPW